MLWHAGCGSYGQGFSSHRSEANGKGKNTGNVEENFSAGAARKRYTHIFSSPTKIITHRNWEPWRVLVSNRRREMFQMMRSKRLRRAWSNMYVLYKPDGYLIRVTWLALGPLCHTCGYERWKGTKRIVSDCMTKKTNQWCARVMKALSTFCQQTRKSSIHSTFLEVRHL